MVCAMLRTQRPEMAAMVSLAVGLAALMMTLDDARTLSDGIQRFLSLASINGQTSQIVLKATGITILTELGVQICQDAGESAMAGRIRLASRVVMLGMAMPLILEIADCVGMLLG